MWIIYRSMARRVTTMNDAVSTSMVATTSNLMVKILAQG